MEFDAMNLVGLLMPMYVTNASAVVFSGKTSLDLGLKWLDGKPLLGKGKTIRGTAFSFTVGLVTAFWFQYFFPGNALGLSAHYFRLAILLCAGTHAGDLAASFLKRRLNFESGKEVWLLDQLDFLAGALILGSIYYIPSLLEIALMVALTLVIHRASNWVAYKIKLKKVPW